MKILKVPPPPKQHILEITPENKILTWVVEPENIVQGHGENTSYDVEYAITFRSIRRYIQVCEKKKCLLCFLP